MKESRLARPGRLDAYGTTIFAEMSARAAAMGAVNLGQGFPDEPGPPEVLETARAAIEEGHNQYAPGRGVAELVEAIAAHSARTYGQEVDPSREVLVTAGATEALMSTILALCGPGDDVVVFEPFFDSYPAAIELSGARMRTVPLRDPDWSFDPDELRAAVGPRTRLVLLNTPHNPTGRVFSHDELQLVADLCLEHDVIAVTDEVYEHLVFSGRRHERIATFEEMADRTVTISSAGKTFSVTGWKIGWLIAPPALVSSATAVKQYVTYTNGTPFQYGVARGLSLPAARIEALAAALEERRDRFCQGLRDIGWSVIEPEATYFCAADVRELGAGGGTEFCWEMLERAGVAGIPMSAFYEPAHAQAGHHLVRFAFCKGKAVLDEALERLARW